jgi:hypothetical protein
MNDLLLACEVRVALMEIKPDIDVTADDGSVLVKTKAPLQQEEDWVHEMRRTAKKIPGVKKIQFDILPSSIFWASVKDKHSVS